LSLSARRSGLLGEVRRRDERVALRLTEKRGLGTGSVAHSVLHERSPEGDAGAWCCEVGEMLDARVYSWKRAGFEGERESVRRS
jgi:hypothetical protein